jgi:hypothetical protein
MIAEFLRQPQVLVTMVATVDAADQVRTVCVLPVPCLRKKPSPRALPISVVAINDPLLRLWRAEAPQCVRGLCVRPQPAGGAV